MKPPYGSFRDTPIPGASHPEEVIKNGLTWGAWVAQSVGSPALDIGSGCEFTGHGFELCVGLCNDSVEPAWGPTSLPHPHSCTLCLLALALSLSLKRNK